MAKNIAAFKCVQHRTNLDYGEMIGVAYMAVAEALADFDPSRGSIENRVGYMVRKRIIDHKRKMDHMSRPQRKRVYGEVRRLGDQLLKFDAYQPDYSLISLESVDSWDNKLVSKAPPVLSSLLVQQAMSILKPRDRRMLEMYYWEAMTMKKIGQFFGINESRVSQIVARCMVKMRNYLETPAAAATN